MRLFMVFGALALFLVASVPSYAGALKEMVDGMTVLPLQYGVNSLAVDGTEVAITRGLFQTEAASTRDLYTVVARQEKDWQWVRLEPSGGKSGSIVLETWPHVSEDSLISLRFLQGNQGRGLYLLIVRRALEEGYAESPAAFVLYELRRDEDFSVLSFQEVATFVSSEKYCNADWAAYRELGLALREEHGEVRCGG